MRPQIIPGANYVLAYIWLGEYIGCQCGSPGTSLPLDTRLCLPTMCAIVVSSFYSSFTTCLILYLALGFIFWGRACFAVFACRSHSPVVFLINVISIRSWQCCRLLLVNTDREIFIVKLRIHTCSTYNIFMIYKSEFAEKGTSLALPAGKNGGRSQLRWCQ